jgi:hypothetical protein
MTDQPRAGLGLRPALRDACRAALRAAAGAATPLGADHTSCKQCAAVVAFRDRFVPLLAIPPQLPAELASREMIDSIHERIVDGLADGGMNALLAGRRVASPIDAWPEVLLASPLAHSVVGTPVLGSDQLTWARLRQTLMANLGTDRSRRVRWGWLLGLAAAAAALISVGQLLSDGSREVPTIVFADLETMPGVDFSVVRYGALR